MKPATSATERKNLLLKHPDVSTWVKDRSPGTAATQLDHLRIFLERSGLDVDGLLHLARKDERKLRNVVLDFIHSQQEAGLKTKYVTNVWWSVRSFLGSVAAAPAWNPTVKSTEADEENASRIVPTHDQVRQIAGAVKSARDRMVVLVLASSGIRIGTFATQNGLADGIRLKHLLDLELDPEPRLARSPSILRVPAFLSKGGKGYYTGITDEAGEAVVTYLKERQRRGEELTPESPLVAPDARGTRESRRSKDGHAFIVRKSLASRVQVAMDTVAPRNLRWTPHSLRAFVSTALEAAESRGLVSRTRREYFLGHALGSTDSLYNLGRTLSPEKVEELRVSYAKCLPLLSLSSRPGDERAAVLEDLVAAVLKAQGAKDDEIAKALEGKLTREEIERIVSSPKAQPVERLVPKEGLSTLLLQGWEFVSPVGNDQAVVRWSRGDFLDTPGGLPSH
jgi:integrase